MNTILSKRCNICCLYQFYQRCQMLRNTYVMLRHILQLLRNNLGNL